MPVAVRVCLECSKEFTPSKQEHRYCCSKHRWAAWDRENPRQRALPLDPAPEPVIQPRDQRVKARGRYFSEQARRIMDRLEEGPVANVELALMFPPATAWRSRLSDVR
jgi:hypothetical protein